MNPIAAAAPVYLVEPVESRVARLETARVDDSARLVRVENGIADVNKWIRGTLLLVACSLAATCLNLGVQLVRTPSAPHNVLTAVVRMFHH